MAFIVEVQHQSAKGLQGIGYGAMVVSEPGTDGCPHGELGLQGFIASQDASAHVGQPGLLAKLLPIGSGGGHGRGAMALAYAGKRLRVGHRLHVLSSLRVTKKAFTAGCSR